MIKSDIIKIKKIDLLDSLYIETQLNNIGIFPIRWAIVDCDESSLQVSVSYETIN